MTLAVIHVVHALILIGIGFYTIIRPSEWTSRLDLFATLVGVVLIIYGIFTIAGCRPY